ncbi:MAG: hypothetical protein OXM03_03180, partial [Chloroflexota bacterium]|nr:hypothetical protein [Chloroflexota bacterium]
IPASTAYTPHEYGYILLSDVRPASDKRFPDSAVQAICTTYAESLYSAQGITAQQKNAAVKAWGRLRWRLYRRGLHLGIRRLIPFLRRGSGVRAPASSPSE